MENPQFERIRQDISENDIVLYMKGSRIFPQDGFSATVVQILSDLNVSYYSVDVLEDRELYQAVKEFTNWPNVPQLYVKGEFVGGSDIVKELQASGELKKLFASHHLSE